jgi:hypothetical protein
MATTFKTFLNNDIASTRTLLHEAIPITGSIASGTYGNNNIKNYTHGMFQSVYDYPYLSSSANHIFDLTVGISSDSVFQSDTPFMAQYSKKRNIYNQMAQVLVNYSTAGDIQQFDQDGNIAAGGHKIKDAFFMNFARLLNKDEIKKGSFTVTFNTGGAPAAPLPESGLVIGDYGASSSFKVNSPTGEYGLLYTSSATPNIGSAVGHLYYQAGIAVITASIFSNDPIGIGRDIEAFPDDFCGFGTQDGTYDTTSYKSVLSGTTIQSFCDGLRNRLTQVQFNNTTELNSTIYFCRANVGDYNYSSNPTYLSASKIRVKGDQPFAEPVSYITTIGMYSPNNELLAVAKLSEPLKKTPSNELTLRVRLDY